MYFSGVVFDLKRYYTCIESQAQPCASSMTVLCMCVHVCVHACNCVCVCACARTMCVHAYNTTCVCVNEYCHSVCLLLANSQRDTDVPMAVSHVVDNVAQRPRQQAKGSVRAEGCRLQIPSHGQTDKSYSNQPLILLQ